MYSKILNGSVFILMDKSAAFIAEINAYVPEKNMGII